MHFDHKIQAFDLLLEMAREGHSLQIDYVGINKVYRITSTYRDNLRRVDISKMEMDLGDTPRRSIFMRCLENLKYTLESIGKYCR